MDTLVVENQKRRMATNISKTDWSSLREFQGGSWTLMIGSQIYNGPWIYMKHILVATFWGTKQHIYIHLGKLLQWFFGFCMKPNWIWWNWWKWQLEVLKKPLKFVLSSSGCGSQWFIHKMDDSIRVWLWTMNRSVVPKENATLIGETHGNLRGPPQCNPAPRSKALLRDY